MGALLGLMLVLTLPDGPGHKGQTVAEAKPSSSIAVGAEHSILKTAVDGVTAVANAVTPVRAVASSKDRTGDVAPNGLVWVHVSKAYLAESIERNVDHEKPARENVLGIIFTGESHTNGKTRLVLHPNDDRATADVEFTGTVRSRTVGHSGPATLRYVSESNFRARKPLIVGDSGISTSTAVVDAPTRLTPTSIQTSLPGLRGRIGDRIARRREAGSRAQAEAIVGRDTARDIRHDFNVKLDAAVADIQNKVQAQIAALKLNGGDGRIVIRSRSTSNFVEVALCPQDAKASELRMASASPFDGNPECSVCIHRSVLTTLMANTELREKWMPMLTSVAVVGDNSVQANGGPKLTMNGDWIALDLSGKQPGQISSRIAATQSLTDR